MAATRTRRERHVEELVRTWLGLGADAAEPPRLPEQLARRLLRDEERERAHRDRWDCWEFSFCESHRDGTLLVPEVDRWVAGERRRLAAEGVPLEPLWPDGTRFAVCLTHDVDLVSPAFTPRQALRSMQTSLERVPDAAVGQRLLRYARPPVRLARAAASGVAQAPATAETLERSVTIEQEAGVVASYFFTVFPGAGASRFDCVYDFEDRCTFRGRRRRIAEVAAELADDGFDIGLHGSYHSAVRPDMLAAEKAALERATGLSVTTTRQHFLHWDVHTTPLLQEDAGLLADTTLGFNRGVGFRAGTSLPFHHFDAASGRTLGLLEVPLIVQDGALLGSSALELDEGLARELIRDLVARVADVGGVVTFLFHPNNLERDDHLAVYRFAIEHALAA